MPDGATSPATELRSAATRLRDDAVHGPVTLSPAVALAVADWLEDQAVVRYGADGECRDEDPALAVARLFLGSEESGDA